MSTPEHPTGGNFIKTIIDEDLAQGKNNSSVVTRFPPEPNGYLHIGHAKSICLNFGIASQYQGRCHLRFDDTNPVKESEEYVNAIKEDVTWLGFEWDGLHHASDYFETLYEYAVELIKKGKAYVDSSSAEEVRRMRGTLTEPGEISPYQNRSVDENLDLFARMKAGEFDDGEHVLRARIDMASGNMNMRDPTLYRIRKVSHVRTGDDWYIYPMYDYTHCLSDSIEGITHSLCTLEFEDHRPLYDWVLDELETPCHPQQIEFARLSLEYTMLSKRRLIQLVEDEHVAGWDDPRMPTISGFRRRGYTKEALREFCERIGITKNDALIEYSVLENCIREDLNEHAWRRMAVLNPIKLVITSLDEDHREDFSFKNHPQKDDEGSRTVPFTQVIYIDADDFSDDPPPKYQRLIEGGEVRLRGSYVIKCHEVVRDEAGEILELRCTHDPATLGKKPEGRKVKGVVHWVSATLGQVATVRVYDHLFTEPNPAAADSLESILNPKSIVEYTNAYVEPALAEASPESRFQFERVGYFVADRRDHSETHPVFNRTVTLRDVWATKK
ncbi:MAG: glutamine--tRNA ligase/YqeY domain fusion protein [Gammaproteobacteria bacterium]|nr:glutamine--tRNA ligase/YqeY domain fusion protein [Gammaproteobacteria bacterium]